MSDPKTLLYKIDIQNGIFKYTVDRKRENNFFLLEFILKKNLYDLEKP